MINLKEKIENLPLPKEVRDCLDQVAKQLVSLDFMLGEYTGTRGTMSHLVNLLLVLERYYADEEAHN